MRVVLTDKAVDDLIGIGRFIHKDAPDRAVTFVEELERCCADLGLMPLAYPAVPGWQRMGVRRRVYRDYVIFYRVDEAAGHVVVLHILHGARDHDRVLNAATD